MVEAGIHNATGQVYVNPWCSASVALTIGCGAEMRI